MSQRTVSRRLIVGGTSTALLLGVVGFVPLLGSAAAACAPTYKDDPGDAVLVADGAAVPGGPDFGNDQDLDILDVTHTVDAGVFSSVVHLAGLKDYGPQVSFVDAFETAFTVNGKTVALEVVRDHNTDPETVTGTLTVAGTATTVPVKGVVDLKASTVTAQVAAPAFETALGGALAGKPFSAMTATTTQVFEAFGLGGPSYGQTMDEAAAPTTASYLFGASCSGGAAPAPTGSGTPIPAPSGSATPTPTPSASASPSPTPTSSIGPDGLFTQPRKACAEFTDPADDADPTGIGFFTEPALDITQVNLKSSPANGLQVFVKLNDASAALLPLFDGPVYGTAFTVNGKAVALSASATGPATATVGGAENKDIKATAKLDTGAGNIVFSVPLAGLSKAVGTTVRVGSAITATTAETAAATAIGDQPADTAAGTKPEEKSYIYGDNTCFKPAPGKLVIDADPRGQYTDTTVLFATLKDADDTPVAGARVLAALTGGRVVAAVTDAEGVADLALPIGVPAGTKVLTVAFGGTSEVGAVRATKPFTVLAERTVLRASGIRGGVQALLVDDDRRPRAVAGQLVTFTVGSKRYSVRTNSRGVAVLTRLAAGTVVKVSYAGSRGYYLAAKTVTTRAR